MGLKQLILLCVIGLVSTGRSFSQELAKLKLSDSISVHFDSGSSLIRNQAALTEQLNNIDLRYGKILLVAYTDTIGKLKFNRVLATKRLLAVKKLVQSTNMKSFVLDTLNQNEQRSTSKSDDNLFRRVDILVYRIEPTIKRGSPMNLLINFYSGSDLFIKESMRNLELLQLILEMDSSLQIVLNGHVCCRADLMLSQRRAEKVKAYLMDHGIDGKRITCKGFSNSVPLVPETTDKNKQLNMRVEVVFLK